MKSNMYTKMRRSYARRFLVKAASAKALAQAKEWLKKRQQELEA